MIRIFVGYDPREAVAYHTFCQSVIDTCSRPNDLEFHPVTGDQRDGTNAFTYERFLVPHRCDFKGRALFVDGDMTCLGDIAELWDHPALGLRDAVAVVKHDYETRYPIKYWNQLNSNYPRKNWSSVVLWNCDYSGHKVLTPEFVAGKEGAWLHRFAWLPDDRIGELPHEWNWLALEQPYNPDAKLVHHTIALPMDHDLGSRDPWRGEWFSAYHDARRYAP